jgi:hypothetical protein
MQVLQQQRVDLAHQLGRAVIALHQLLARAFGGAVGEPELGGERRLQVEHQPVLAPSRQIVQPNPQIGDRSLLTRHRAGLRRRHQAVAGELAPRVPEPGCAGDPDDGLQIAQSARTFLDVGLQVVRGVVVFEMALLLLERLRVVERPHVELGIEHAHEFSVEAARARQEAMLEQARADGGVAHLDRALTDRAHRVRQLDAAVPQRGQQALDRRRAIPVRDVAEQNEDVDVRMRIELSAAVAAHGDQGCGRNGGFLPRSDHDLVGEPREAAQQA